MLETKVKVLRGLEITVEFTEYGLEEGEFKVTHIAGKESKRANWIKNRIEEAGETQKVLDACNEELFLCKFHGCN